MSFGRGGIGQRRDRTRDHYFSWDGSSRDDLGNIILTTQHIFRGIVERSETVVLQGTAGEPYQKGDMFKINKKGPSDTDGVYFSGANDYDSRVSTQELEARREANKVSIDLLLLEEGAQSGWRAKEGRGQGLLVGRWNDKEQVLLNPGQPVVYEGTLGNKKVLSYHTAEIEKPRLLVVPDNAIIEGSSAFHPMGEGKGLIHYGLHPMSSKTSQLDSMMLRTNIVESSDVPWSDLSHPLQLEGDVDSRILLSVTDNIICGQTLVVMEKGTSMDLFTRKGIQGYLRGTELDGKEVNLIWTGNSSFAPEIVFNQMVQSRIKGRPQQAYVEFFPRRQNVSFAHTFTRLFDIRESLEQQQAKRILRAMLK